MDLNLTNRTAIVTGGATGLGREFVLSLAKEGVNICFTYMREEEHPERLIETVKASANVEIIAVKTDLSDEQSRENLFATCIDRLGKADILVNNAGINRDAMLHKLTEADWDTVIDVNLKGTFLCMQQAAIRMRERGAGRIINIASASWLGNVGQTNYSASKAGVVGMTKTACRELAKKGVTVNAICPGFIDTDMTRGVPENVWQIMISKIPAGYAGEAKDVGECVAFLASDGARYINGEVINVGGGMVL